MEDSIGLGMRKTRRSVTHGLVKGEGPKGNFIFLSV